MTADIRSALEELTSEEWDRLRLRLWLKFGEQLRKIPGAPDPDDLLDDAVKDLLADKRHCPLDRISLPVCLFNIVRSKVSHIKKEWEKNMSKRRTEPVEEIDLPANIAGQRTETTEYEQSRSSEDTMMERMTENRPSGLREQILSLVDDDPLLKQMVEYQLDQAGEPVKSEKLAEALRVDIKEIYNASRRLKSKLKGLNTRIKSKKGGDHDSDL